MANSAVAIGVLAKFTNRDITIAVMLASLKKHRIAKLISTTHIKLHISLVLVPSKALKSNDSHHGLQKHIASQARIGRFGKLRVLVEAHFEDSKTLIVDVYWISNRLD